MMFPYTSVGQIQLGAGVEVGDLVLQPTQTLQRQIDEQVVQIQRLQQLLEVERRRPGSSLLSLRRIQLEAEIRTRSQQLAGLRSQLAAQQEQARANARPDSPETIALRQWQAYLVNAGLLQAPFNPLRPTSPITGVEDELTRAATARFEASRGLPVTARFQPAYLEMIKTSTVPMGGGGPISEGGPPPAAPNYLVPAAIAVGAVVLLAGGYYLTRPR